MKKLFLSSLIVFITAFMMSSPSVCFSEQPDPKVWEYLSDDFYYKKKNLIKKSDIISAWTYRTITGEEKKYLIEHFRESDLGKSIRYQNLDHQVMFLDIDCRQKMSRIKKLANYDDQKNVLYEETYQNSEWTEIAPESKLDEIYKKLCTTSGNREKINAFKKQCEKACEGWSTSEQEKLFGDKFTHQCHYNTRLDKCFILIKYTKKHLKVLREINDNKIYGSFRAKQDGTAIICNVLEKTCNSREAWNALVKPFTEE